MASHDVLKMAFGIWAVGVFILATGALILDGLSPELRDKFRTKKYLARRKEMFEQGYIMIEDYGYPGGMLGFIATWFTVIPSAIVFLTVYFMCIFGYL